MGNPLGPVQPGQKLSLLFCAVDRDGEVIIPNGSFVPRQGIISTSSAVPPAWISSSAFWAATPPRCGGSFSWAAVRSLCIWPSCWRRCRCRSRSWNSARPAAVFSVNCSPFHHHLRRRHRSGASGLREPLPPVMPSWLSPTGMKTTSSSPVRRPTGAFPKSSPNQPAELQPYRPGRWSGQHHLPKQLATSHILQVVRGMQNSQGSVMNALYRIADRGRRGHGVYRYRLHPPSGHALPGTCP